MPWIANVACVLRFPRRREAACSVLVRLRGKPVRNGTLEGFFNASIDAALAMQTMILCAESAGLGVCPISVIRNEVDKVADGSGACPISFFRLPDCASAIRKGEGYRQPAAAAPSPSTHRDRYDDSGTACRRSTITTAEGMRSTRYQKISSAANAEFGEAAEFYGWSEGQDEASRQGRRCRVPALPAFAHGFRFRLRRTMLHQDSQYLTYASR